MFKSTKKNIECGKFLLIANISAHCYVTAFVSLCIGCVAWIYPVPVDKVSSSAWGSKGNNTFFLDSEIGQLQSCLECDTNTEGFDSRMRRRVLSSSVTTASLISYGGQAAAESSFVPSGATDQPLRSGDTPFHSVRKCKVVKLSNGLPVLLVSDALTSRASVALTVSGAGQWADPVDLAGAAHLLEHMLLSYPSRSAFRASRDFEDWLGDITQEGSSNGFTAYDKVCFHFSCKPQALAPALERFAGLFRLENVLVICYDTAALRREVKRVDAELDFNNVDVQSYYLLKSFVSPEHPFSSFSMGSLETLDRIPKSRTIDVSRKLVDFFQKNYLPTQSVLVVVAPQELPALERSIAPFASTLSRYLPSRRAYVRRLSLISKATSGTSSNAITTYPGGFLRGNRLKHVILYRKSSAPTSGRVELEKMTVDWSLSLEYSNYEQRRSSESGYTITATHVAFVMAQILGRKGPGSLSLFLLRRGWIPSGSTSSAPRISVALDVSGFQIIRLELWLTLDGFINRSAVVAAIYDALGTVQDRNALTLPLLAQYASIAKLHAYTLAQRPSDAIELAVDALFYGIEGPQGLAGGKWNRFPSLSEDRNGIEQLQRVMTHALREFGDYDNTVITITAGKEALARTSSVVFDEPIPPLSSARWLREPVTGARFCFVELVRLTSRVEEQVLSRVVDAQELLPPVLNPLVPTSIRKPRIFSPTELPFWFPNERAVYPTVTQGSTVLRRSLPELSSFASDRTWRVLVPRLYQRGLPLPKGPPEATCRCVFVLQLLSPRPARASVRQAAQADLWRLSFEDAIVDLGELGGPGGLAYDWTFTKFGLRLAFLGISQTLPSYVRRYCRRLVEYPSELLQSPEQLPTKIQSYAVNSAKRQPALMSQRYRRIISNLRSSNAHDAAREATAFLQSCTGAVSFAQGDLLPQEVDALMQDLLDIFSDACHLNDSDLKKGTTIAIPTIDDLIYKPLWKPRYASPCTLPGMTFMSDACGRVPR